MPRVNRFGFPITALGPGRRLAVWFQGCALACRGCLARDTWDPGGGADRTVADLTRLWTDALRAGADGLTVSGGEPLAQPDGLAAFLAAAAGVRDDLAPDADLLVYTGHEPAEITDPAPLAHADAVITGRYDVTRPTRLIWRGSANQILTPRTPRGRARYAPYLDHEPERAPMQVAVNDRHVWFAGVPRRGDLNRLRRELADRGVTFEEVSWRS
ncbi:4Fe-4S single cluster domain-containing protein [Actinomadura algeriensis]|uniref:Anaerobic ribonucleoside-triphosphate reductase activating protein n=1 Tax=Actinomadura algeriensis TaxID=1679523 RepID=A0ABR9K2K0_9ACTN|nr:4Fe-4S single cluster domain-containing protein [Actinomadura algeriensis]MBE1537053.1 anaerobic ribonucleoside-triphosphate reductase activating protein [Actinomadura algeriensis]